MTDENRIEGPLDQLLVRYDDLTVNSTRFDRLVAAPSNEHMRIMWMGWTLVTAVCGIIVLVVFLGLLSSPARKKAFNLYLLWLMVPDILFSLLCCWTCLQNYTLGHYSSLWMCHFQSFYAMFAIAANAWLNAVVCQQVHTMLVVHAKQPQQTYRPPKTIQVLSHVGLVYLWSAFVASWPLLGVPLANYGIRWWPHKTTLVSGVECLPMDFGTASTAFFYGVFFPSLMGAPLIYAFYLMYDIYHKELLPPEGKRRQLTVFFLRLVVVFLVMWTPALLFLFVSGQWLSPWVKWVGGSWCHFQGAVSAIASLWKPDVYHAVHCFLTCRCCAQQTVDPKDLQRLHTTKRYAKKLQKYAKELEAVAEELQLESTSTVSTLYTRELQEITKEIQHKTTTRAATIDRSCRREMGLLESFTDIPWGGGVPFTRVTRDVPSTTLEGSEKSSSSAAAANEEIVDLEDPNQNKQEVCEEEEKEESESDCAFETFACQELAPEPATIVALTGEDSSTNLIAALGLDSDSDCSDVDPSAFEDHQEPPGVDVSCRSEIGDFPSKSVSSITATSVVTSIQTHCRFLIAVEDYDT